MCSFPLECSVRNEDWVVEHSTRPSLQCLLLGRDLWIHRNHRVGAAAVAAAVAEVPRNPRLTKDSRLEGLGVLRNQWVVVPDAGDDFPLDTDWVVLRRPGNGFPSGLHLVGRCPWGQPTPTLRSTSEQLPHQLFQPLCHQPSQHSGNLPIHGTGIDG